MTISRRINAERVVLFGWSRAILLQLAHPLVAAGVSDHSSMRDGALAAARRLRQTVAAMTRLTFGTADAHAATIETIAAIHRRVHGRLAHAVGPWAAGTRYSAEDPALLLWVHATLTESLPLVYERLVRPLTSADRDEYCREAAVVARELGTGATVPECWRDLQDYLAERHASGEIVVGQEARVLAAEVLSPPFGALVAPARRFNRLITTGLLPDQVREQYGLRWRESDARELQRWIRLLRGIRQLTPQRLREWPEASRRDAL